MRKRLLWQGFFPKEIKMIVFHKYALFRSHFSNPHSRRPFGWEGRPHAKLHAPHTERSTPHAPAPSVVPLHGISYSHYGIPLEGQASHPKNLNRAICPNNACHLSDLNFYQFHFLTLRVGGVLGLRLGGKTPRSSAFRSSDLTYPIFKTIVNKGVRK